MEIRRAQADDAAAIAVIIMPVIRAGETYAIDPALPQADALALWLGPDRETFVAQADGDIIGTYYLRANQPGGGAHVANCGYMTAAHATGRGVARAMALHSIDHARQRGFLAMQYNFVISTNTRAVALWQALGFAIVGRLPLAYRHPVHGLVDALVMHRPI
jgi:ribosomal protein S18 acetylase RimI-like enzyme